MARKRLNTTQFAAKHGVSTGRIRQLAIAGRIPEAEKVGHSWVFPENARILHPPERDRGFDKIKEWLRSEDWEREQKPEQVVREFINDARYWLDNT